MSSYSKNEFIWQWLGEDDKWKNYNDVTNKFIEEQYKKNVDECCVKICQRNYRIQFTDRTQHNVNTKFFRKIRRIKYQWQWQNSKGLWTNYTESVSNQIENLFCTQNNYNSPIKIKIKCRSYKINPFDRSQINIATNCNRKIRRIPINDHDKKQNQNDIKQHDVKQDDDGDIKQDNELHFDITGQGTIQLIQTVNTENKQTPFKIVLYNKNIKQLVNITLNVNDKQTSLKYTVNEKTTTTIESKNADHRLVNKGNGIYSYWLSVNGNNNTIKYGIGEIRDKLTKFTYCYDKAEDENMSKFLKEINCAQILYDTTNNSDKIICCVHRDHVNPEPVLIIDGDDLTMDDVDRKNNTFLVAQNLPKECLNLYNTISGAKFTLETESFPQFAAAISKSVTNPNGWCYKKLKEKSYLRITLGDDHGNSPGIPFVLEIWPSGNCSPIHNHANAYAVIRVLYGEILCNVYPYLSQYKNQEFIKKILKKNDITYIKPGINQVHKLENISDDVAITIQCYQYGSNDNKHYEYFDYIKQRKIHRFEPNNDCNFGEFKQKMKTEWNQWYR